MDWSEVLFIGTGFEVVIESDCFLWKLDYSDGKRLIETFRLEIPEARNCHCVVFASLYQLSSII